MTAYKRVLLKLSGEGLAGDDGFGIHPGLIADIAAQVGEVHELGTEVCIVIGGGNIIRGMTAASQGMDRRLEFWERVSLHVHLAICNGCTNFSKQAALIRKAMQRLAD